MFTHFICTKKIKIKKKVEYGVSKCAMIKVDMVVVILFFINIYSGDKLIKTLFYFFSKLSVGKVAAQVELFFFFFYIICLCL